MRTFSILFLSLLSAQNVWAIRAATDAEKTEIDAQLKLAESLQKGHAEKNYEDGIGAKEANFANGGWQKNSEDQVADLKEIDDLKKQRDLYRDRAIHLTLRAYDLVPTDAATGALRMPAGQVVMAGPWKNKHASWIPVAGENNGRTASDVKGHPIPIPPAVDPTGLTYPVAFTDIDGVTMILPESFKSPAVLALTLLHEQTHFRQFTTAGVGDKCTRSSCEVAALQAEESALDHIGLTPAEKEAERNYLHGNGHNGELDRWKERVQDEHQTGKVLEWPWGDNKSTPIPPHTNDAQIELRKRFDDLDGVVAAELVLTREATHRPNIHASKEVSFLHDLAGIQQDLRQIKDALAAQETADYIVYRAELDMYKRQVDEHDRIIHEKIEADARIREDHNRQVREHYDDMMKRWAYLRTMTGLACSNPNALDQLGREGKAPGVSLDGIDFDWEMRPTQVEATRDRPAMNSCQKYILTAIRNANGMTSGSEMIALARRYRREHPTLIDSFTTSIGDFFSAIGRAGTSIGDFFTPPPGAFQNNSDRERSSGNNSDGTDHTRHAPDVMGTRSAGQARGVLGGGSWN